MSWQLATLGLQDENINARLEDICLYQEVVLTPLLDPNALYQLPATEVVLVVDLAAQDQKVIHQWLDEHDSEMRLPNLRVVLIANMGSAVTPELKACLTRFEDSLLIERAHSAPLPLLELLIQEEKKRRSLGDRLQLATQAAFSAMAASGQLGEVIRFLELAFNCDNFDGLFKIAEDVLGKLGLSADGVFFVGGQMLDYCSINPDARNLLVQSQRAGRLVDVPEGLIVNYETVSALIYDMPEAGSEAEGQLRDTLATLFQSCHFCIKAIYAELASHQAERAKLLFLSTLSHELRTPMNAILGFSRLLSRHQDGDQFKSRDIAGLKAVEDNANRLMNVIDDLLALCDIDENTVRSETVNLRDMLYAEIEFAQQLSDKTGVGFSVDALPLDVMISTDAKRLRMIIHCLLSNAFKFTQQGQVHLTAEVHTADAGLRWVHLSVEDSGIGIAEEHFERIFEPFEQISTGLSRASEGAGLGLAVVRQYTRQLGGEMVVQSELGKGSLFEIRLPLLLNSD